MSKLSNQLLGVDFTPGSNYGTPAIRADFQPTTKDMRGYVSGMPYRRMFHGQMVGVLPGVSAEFRRNGYIRHLNPRFTDNQLPEYFRPIGYRSRDLDCQPADSDLSPDDLLTAMALYFEPGPDMAEAQRHMLLSNCMLPNLAASFLSTNSTSATTPLGKTASWIVKDKK